MPKTIVMQFDTFGNSKLDAQGFVGSSCKDATKNYIAALSAKDKDDKNKPEFGLPNQSGQTQAQGRW